MTLSEVVRGFLAGRRGERPAPTREAQVVRATSIPWLLLAGTLAASLAACAPGSDAGPGAEATASASGPAVVESPAATATTEPRTATAADEPRTDHTSEDIMNLTIGGTVLTATLADNSSAEALKDLLAGGPVTIDMRDYANMEKVGSLGTSLPRNDEQITTEAGDLILYQGNAFVIYYAPNSWDFTRLGRINDTTATELRQALGSGDVSVTLSLP